MDKDLLKAKGLDPQNIKRAYVKGYKLKIGERATLEQHKGARSYGCIMELKSDELQNLYSGEGVEDYVPQLVQANTTVGESLEAVTYILPVEKITGCNSEYASKLAGIAKKLDLPDDYIDEVEAWID